MIGSQSARELLAFGVALSMLITIMAPLGGAALAQARKSEATTVSAPPVPAEPGSTSASYGDWILRCQRGLTTEKPQRVCEVAQSMQVQGQTQPIAQIAVGRAGAGQTFQAAVLLPPNVAFPSSVRVLMDEKDATGIELAWRRCLPGACVADAVVKEEALRRWRGVTEPGRITFKNASGQDVAIPLSFRGLAQALDALAKEPS